MMLVLLTSPSYKVLAYKLNFIDNYEGAGRKIEKKSLETLLKSPKNLKLQPKYKTC